MQIAGGSGCRGVARLGIPQHAAEKAAESSRVEGFAGEFQFRASRLGSARLCLRSLAVAGRQLVL
jgi:hypothetical protein